MKTRNGLLVLAGLMLAWAGVASAELTVSWPGERQVVAAKGETAPAGAGAFTASDHSGNYAGVTDWADKNGGTGFGEWNAKLSGDDVSVTRSLDADGGFYMQAGANRGEIAMIRSLETASGVPVSLESGQFAVREWGEADEPGDFLGFAVYGSSDGAAGSELFRWGVRLATIEGMADPVTAFMCSTNGGSSYQFITDGYPPAGVDYSLTWAQLGGTMHFTLSAADEGTENYRFSDHTVDVPTTAQVMSIAAVLTESGLETHGGVDGSEMTFDNMSVTGPTPAVPEPGTLGLLAAGLAALWRRKAKREK